MGNFSYPEFCHICMVLFVMFFPNNCSDDTPPETRGAASTHGHLQVCQRASAEAPNMAAELKEKSCQPP